jgi:two-component system nitrogen regulation response regulator NtrX
MAKKILIVDDEASIRESLAGILSDEGFLPVSVASAEAAFPLLAEGGIDLVLLDIWMPGMDGMEALKRIKGEDPGLPVIMISGHGSIDTAVRATKMGAYDFIEKPPSYDKILLSINNALNLVRLEQENLLLRQKAGPAPVLTGTSEVMLRLKDEIERVAPTDAWVLITGEHGTGKELVAQTIHRLSCQARSPMVEVNCAAIPEDLIEAELFGHEKGAFTGAATARKGRFDQADNGTLFLDEIADMSLKTQAKILRILQEQKFERVGGTRTISVNVRVLAATNKNLEQEMAAGNFRADLYWRLNVVPLVVPPLRDRLADLPLFVQEFSREFARKGFGRKQFSPEALQAMISHSWPGNVRELRNFVERVVIMTSEEEISRETILRLLPGRPHGSQDVAADEAGLYRLKNFKEAKRAFEREFLRVLLQDHQGNISQTAEAIGMERSHLHKKLKALDLEES